MIKKIFLGSFLIAFGLIYQYQWFSYFEQQMYCKLSLNNITVSLKKTDWYLCKTYVSSLEIGMKKTYKDILVIQWYIDRKYDVDYRKWVKQPMLDKLNLMQKLRIDILASMQKFEKNLLVTSKKYFLDWIGNYKWQLMDSLDKLKALNSTTYASSRYISLVNQQLAVIINIEKATSFDTLNLLIPKYIYFKQQLEWK